jgi:hypothetical protein
VVPIKDVLMNYQCITMVNFKPPIRSLYGNSNENKLNTIFVGSNKWEAYNIRSHLLLAGNKAILKCIYKLTFCIASYLPLKILWYEKNHFHNCFEKPFLLADVLSKQVYLIMPLLQ